MTADPNTIHAEFPSGTRIGRYRLEDPVGQGGMGTVYRAFDETTNRNVALKVLAEGISRPLLERFLQECEAQAKIRHPHVMPVYDRAWLAEDRPYFTMELLYEPIALADVVEHVAKGSLASTYPRLRHWNDTARLIADVLVPVADGIDAANREYRIQHRDLKPDNILIDIRTRRPYVIDFGICRSMDEGGDEGRIVGTPRFLSPEQARGQVNDRTDVWGLGSLLRYVLSGDAPIQGSSPFTRQEVEKRIEALKEAELEAEREGNTARAAGYASRRKQLTDPAFRTVNDLYDDARAGKYLPLPEHTAPALRAIVEKSMAADPRDRYEDAAAFARDVRTWLTGGSVQALAEAGATGAAVDAARRALRRHLMTGVAVLLGIVIGVVSGYAVFSKPPLRPDFRVEDLLTDVDRLEASLDALASEDGRPIYVTAQRFLALRNDHQRMRTTLTSLEDAPGLEAVRTRWKALEDRLQGTRVVIRGNAAGDWEHTDLLGATPEVTVFESGERLTPGLHRLVAGGAPGIYLTITVPTRAAGDDAPIEYAIPAFPADAPESMVWVPGTSLLVSTQPVTCEQYAEWLDELPSKERKSHVPPQGFYQGDPSDSTRYLAMPEFQNEPVAGVKVEHMLAYAAWRSELIGFSLRLPTDDEWRTFAGEAALSDPAMDRLFDWRRAPRLRSWQRAPLAGVQRVFRAPGEVVYASSPDVSTFVIKGVTSGKGAAPLPSLVRRSTPLPKDGSHGASFRLVLSLD